MSAKCIEEIRSVFDAEMNELMKVKDYLNEKEIEKIINLLENCKGKVILCGMGKPGHIARKMSATMSSMGISSFFLHPAEALHGDLGTVSKDDVIIIISNSGETAEVCNMLPNLKIMGVPIVAMTSYPKSTLAQYSDYIIEFPTIKEATSFGLAPTSSSTVELVMGDALAIVVAKHKNFNKSDFAMYHPGGTLGKKLTVYVSNIMHKDNENPVIQKEKMLVDVIYLLSKTGLGAVSIIDNNGELCGLVTDGDLKRYMEKSINIYETPIKSVMTCNPITIGLDSLAVEALQLMEKREKQLSVLPVLEGKKVVGLVRAHDIIRTGIFL